MTKKLWSLVLGLVSIYSLFLGPVAHAAEAPSVTVTIQDDIAWVEVVATESVEGLRVKIMAPGTRSARTLWQTCRFAGTTSGTYRCGIDAAEGSLAQKRAGTWAANVQSGGIRVASTTFTL